MSKGIIKFLIVLTIFFCGASSVTAQGVFGVNAPKVVAMDEVFRIVFTATDKVDNFQGPQTKDFHILAGPVSSTMSSTNIINGKRTHTYEVSYTYTLQPKEIGVFVIPSATVKIGKNTYTSDPITIEVVAQQKQEKSSQDSDGGQGTGISANDILLKLHLNKTKVVKGEPIIATLKLYTRVGISGFEDIKFPVFNGFWSQEIETPTNIEFARETLDGQIYDAALLRKYMLLPQQSGVINIDPAEMICQIQVRSNAPSRSVFDDFFDNYQTLRKRITTKQIKVNVAELPSNAPASFTGGVGKFKMNAELSVDKLKAHEAASLIVTINGTGNINLIEQPKVTLPVDFESYDVKSSEKVSSTSSGTNGSKIFEFPFIPRSHGEFTIEPIYFTYYDIAQKKYITLSSKPISINVERGNDTGSSVIVPGVNKQYVKSLGEDIRFIVADGSHLSKSGVLFAGSILFYVLIVVAIILFLVVSMILNKLIDRKKDIAGSKNRKAKKVAKARLKKAEMLLKQSLYSAFYEELHKALMGYVSDKLALPVADLNRDNISENLLSKGNSEDIVKRFLDELDACEYARYAPSSDNSAMDKHYKEAIIVISEIES